MNYNISYHRIKAKGLDPLVRHVTFYAEQMGINEIGVFDHTVDEYIPPGIIFVFPKGAIRLGGSPTLSRLGTYKSNILYPIPDLVFRVTSHSIDCMGCPIGGYAFPDTIYHYYNQPRQVGRWESGQPTLEFIGLERLVLR